MEYPLLHVYPQIGPRQAVKIVANTEGLITLSIALLEAISITEKGSSEVFCADAEAYEVQVVRNDSNNTWGKLKLPYVFSSSSQNNVNEDNFRTIGYASFDKKGNWRVNDPPLTVPVQRGHKYCPTLTSSLEKVNVILVISPWGACQLQALRFSIKQLGRDTDSVLNVKSQDNRARQTLPQ